MTVIELVAEYFPGASPEVCKSILWGCTGYPCFFQNEGTYKQVLRPQLKEMAERSGGDPVLALSLADEDMEKAMKATEEPHEDD